MSVQKSVQGNVVLFASGALVTAGFFGAFGSLAQQIGTTGDLGFSEVFRLTVYAVTFWAFLLSVGVTLASFVEERRARTVIMSVGFVPSVVLTVVVAASLIAQMFQWGDGLVSAASFFGSAVAALVLAGWGAGWAGWALLRDAGLRIVRVVDDPDGTPGEAPEGPAEAAVGLDETNPDG